MVRFGVLGTVEVRVGDQVLSAGHARQQCVLAALLVDAGRLVTTDQLAERVWGERQPQRARAALHSYVSRLRRIVARAGDTAVERHGGGYVLRVDAAAVDLHRFRDLNTRARAADDGHAVALYDEALALWRGEPLGAVESAWADELRADLRHERLVAETERNDRALRQGRHEHLLTELTARAAEYPLDERLAAQLILALYRSGRPAEALDAYQRVRRQLVEELGIDPGEPLQRLYQRILARDTTLTVPRRPEAVAPAVTRAASQLPPTVRHLIGRDDELAYLDARLETLKDGFGCSSGSALVITITGGGGIGKTTLAQSWARRVGKHFPDGQLHLDLRGFGPGESPLPAAEALHRLLDSLGVGPDRLPAATDDRTALLRSLTENRRLLVVLDNAHNTAQVRPLLPGGGECLVLVTSRRRLPGLIVHHQAQHLALDVLAPQAARDLVVGRLSETRAAADPQALDDLVAHCGGLPLALAIVAARVLTNPAMPLRSLLDELRDQHVGLQALSVDEGPDSDLVAAFSWSYRALTPPAARMFRLLALHPGPDIVLPAVASLAAETCSAARALLEELADASLLQRSGTDRYRLHDLLRAYAGTRLTADEPAAPRRAAELRLLDHYLHTARAADRLLDEHRDPIAVLPPRPGTHIAAPTTHDEAVAWFTAEHAALVAAVSQAADAGCNDHAWRLAWTLTTHLQRRGSWDEWRHIQRTALQAALQVGEHDALAHSRHGLALACAWTGRYDEARALLDQAMESYALTADRTGQAHTQRALSWVSQKQGRHPEALTHAVATLRHYTAAGFLPGRASALNVIGWCQSLLGRHRQARTACRRAVELFQQVGNRTGQAYSWDSLAHAHVGLGEHGDAITCYRNALNLFRALDDRYQQAETLVGLGEALCSVGDHAQGHASYRDALHLLEELGHQDADQVRDRLLAADDHH